MFSLASFSASRQCLPLALFIVAGCSLPQRAAPPGPNLPSPWLGNGPSSLAGPSATAMLVEDPVVLPVASSSAASTTDPFQAIATDAPPSQITSKGPHPVPTLGIKQEGPLQTNKFYANLFLGNQTNPVWTDPYSVAWIKSLGTTGSWGMGISHIDPKQRAYGQPNPNITGSPVSDVINPVGIESLIFSAAELGSSTTLTTDGLEMFSINAHLSPSGGSSSSITFPLVQGMGLVSAVYDNLTPVIQSGVGIFNMSSAASPAGGIYKYQITTQDQNQWLLYAIPANNGPDPNFKLSNNTLIGPTSAWSGLLQIGKNPAGATGEALYDANAGMYVTSCAMTGSVSGSTGNYTLAWSINSTQDGSGEDLLLYALPHHLASFTPVTAAFLKNMSLATTTSGNATAITGSIWTLSEPALPVDMGFAPWSPVNGTRTSLSPAAVSAIQAVASSDVGQDMNAQINVNSFYYAGKALSKFAQMIWTLQNLAGSQSLAAQGLTKLEAGFDLFTNNTNQFPLVYDTTWHGAVSSVWNDSGADFGNSYYDDHHFHYGYFLHAAAVVGSMDPTWLAVNKDYINTMARDVSNPSSDDTYFPQFRSFDWYRGHSWAKGLFDSGDGKDEESSSEDVMFAYGLKMWGQTLGDASMEARGNLMLAVLARSLQTYILMESNNTVQPANFIDNKAAGITFQNKIDHTTYFGTNQEYIEGIHMLPLVPASTLTRTQAFVQQEWDTYFAANASDPAENVVGGWKGVLYANLAIVDPTTSFDFFSTPGFDQGLLDGGASLTWYLAFAAGLGGA